MRYPEELSYKEVVTPAQLNRTGISQRSSLSPGAQECSLAPQQDTEYSPTSDGLH